MPVMINLYQLAHDYSNLAGRAGPIASDLLHACADYGMDNKALRRTAKGIPKTRRKSKPQINSQPLLYQPIFQMPFHSQGPIHLD
jgi:hypothetical protein